MSRSTYHTHIRDQEQALNSINDAAWQEIVDLLPPDVITQARIHKAFLRARGLHDPLDLLRGIFSYVFCMESFREVGAWALSTELSSNGERSWAKRTRQAADWLLWLVQTLLIPTQEQQRHEEMGATRGLQRTGSPGGCHLSVYVETDRRNASLAL